MAGAPDLTLAEPSVAARADELQFAADVAAWLREQSQAGDAVFWLLHWARSSPITVTGARGVATRRAGGRLPIAQSDAARQPRASVPCDTMATSIQSERG